MVKFADMRYYNYQSPYHVMVGANLILAFAMLAVINNISYEKKKLFHKTF